MIDHNLLREAVTKYVTAQELEEALNVLRDNHKILLTQEAELFMGFMTKEIITQAGEDDEQAIHLKLRCNILETARQIGVRDIKHITIEIIDLITSFVLALTWEKCREIIETNKDIFFSNRAETVFLFMIQLISDENGSTKAYKSHHELMKSCYQKGIDKAFAEVDCKECSLYFSRSVRGHIMDYAKASTFTKKKQIVEKTKDFLLTDEGEDAMRQLTDYNRENTQLFKDLNEVLDLLVKCRRMGIDAAFAERSNKN